MNRIPINEIIKALGEIRDAINAITHTETGRLLKQHSEVEVQREWLNRRAVERSQRRYFEQLRAIQADQEMRRIARESREVEEGSSERENLTGLDSGRIGPAFEEADVQITTRALNAATGIERFCRSLYVQPKPMPSPGDIRKVFAPLAEWGERLTERRERLAHPEHHGPGWTYNPDGTRCLRGGGVDQVLNRVAWQKLLWLIAQHKTYVDAAQALGINAKMIACIVESSKHGGPAFPCNAKTFRAINEEIELSERKG